MAPESIALGILLLGGLAVAVAWPWLRPTTRRRLRPTQDLQQEYQALVAAIRDLDFDYRAGVVMEEDYQRLRHHLVLQAVSLLQHLDRSPGWEERLEAQVEDMVRALRARRRRAAALPDGGEARRCAECGARVQPEDRFCARCGAQQQTSPRPQREALCTECRAPLAADDRFCTRCGAQRLKEVPIPS